ncbi:hypothetical protein [Plesiocystis pacifica]|uniref:hypothetical protein n=1 Tax=Plesiocystis pacifica TaxID=191768 RepID=UPI0012F98661|nr:hypothetical protein [Plesiocystis pacifica]
MNSERWPPCYDAEELQQNIRELVSKNQLHTSFFTANTSQGLCQGDILKLSAEMPLIDEHGNVAALELFDYWMFVGNTCDTDRVDVLTSQVVPLHDLGGLQSHEITNLERYSLNRRFFVPNWPGSPHQAWVLEFTELCAASLDFLKKQTVVARMQRYSWYLLHSCLVRYLARDDGRFDE